MDAGLEADAMCPACQALRAEQDRLERQHKATMAAIEARRDLLRPCYPQTDYDELAWARYWRERGIENTTPRHEGGQCNGI